MSKPTRKCDYCKVDDTNKDEMEVIAKEGKDGKRTTYKYYHKEPCYKRFLKRQEFREQERQELDDLCNVIMSIYGVKVLPNSIYPMLQDLRNGTKFYGKKDYRYKQGYRYNLIARTFEYVSENIDYANAHKNFSGFTQAFRYGLAIVCDKLMIVESKQKRQESYDSISKRRDEVQNLNNETLDFNKTDSRKDDMDISDLLE